MDISSKARLGLGFAIIAVVAAAGCAAATTPESGPEADVAAPASAKSPGYADVGAYRLDISRLGALAAPARELTLLPRQAYNERFVRERLLGTGETFTTTARAGTRVRSESPSFALEIDDVKGSLLALTTVPDAGGEPLDLAVVEADALARLTSWGIPSAEIGDVVTRPLMAQGDGRDGSKEKASTLAYKTFVFRGLGGVPVLGHRAVVTHGRDGQMSKVLAAWPALAARGHKLHPGLSLDAIPAAVAKALDALGKPQRAASLHWVYEPSQAPSGDVVLTLKIAADLPAIEHEEIVEEPEVELIDVGATL